MSQAAVSQADSGALARARVMFQRAEWAARAFARLDHGQVAAIVHAAAEAGYESAARYAEWAVRETGFGVVEHKVTKNQLSSRGIEEYYRGDDFVSPRFDTAAGVAAIPRPAGVIFALTPSTNPIATVFVKTLLALMTRNAIVISPHPLAKACCVDAARHLAAAAESAGAPAGAVQVIEEPTIPLIDALMSDALTSVILATGGTAVVQAAHRSGNPAIGVGPGNIPVLIDATADLESPARRLIDSKAFDNSVLCTNESVAIVVESVADQFQRLLRDAGGHICSAEETDRVRAYLFPEGRFRIEAVGKDAAVIAQAAGVRVPRGTRVLVAPFRRIQREESLAHEKLCPVLGLVTVPSAQAGIEAARGLLRIAGAGHSAAIHSRDPRTIMAFGMAVNVLRVAVNAGSSTGSAGFDTNLAPTMTIGTGFFGGSNLGENLRPDHLVNWTRVAYGKDALQGFDELTRVDPWETAGPSPSLSLQASDLAPRARPELDELRAQIRLLVLEELKGLQR